MKMTVNNISINVEQYGCGEWTLVFLHYYGGSSRTWQRVISQLSDQYSIIAIDHRGWGHSDAPGSGYQIADLASDAEGVIAALKLKRYILIGHSMGGKVAQLMASRRPQGLEGLILIAPSPPSPMRLSAEERDRLVNAYSSRESVEFVIDNVLTSKPLSPEIREQVIEDSLNASAAAKAAWPEIAMNEDITREVAAINVPVTVISGEFDRVDTPDRLQKELLPRIPHAAMRIIEGTGHLSPLESPQDIAGYISNFAASIERSDSVYRTPADTIAAFDAAFNAGNIDELMSVFSNLATMKMTNEVIVEQDVVGLRNALTALIATGAQISNQIRTLIPSGDLLLAIISWSLTTTLQDGTHRHEQGIATQVLEKGADHGWRLRISNPLGVS
ncbi:alpha/beta fold hydrolase [Tatumella saanichensis]|uniref:alpha/beta fold hydrolase n=1 Tax=Tatumella saanichensis TaxID=480813 RepID=UPI0004A26CBB|nr:alpha/beta fold hydrolase [Tatumella saanichensis]